MQELKEALKFDFKYLRQKQIFSVHPKKGVNGRRPTIKAGKKSIA